MANTGRPPTALDDTGTGYAFILLGWVPPAVAAAVGGVIGALATGDVLVFVQAFIGGTIGGYITALVLLFTVGHSLSGNVGERVANVFLASVVAASFAAAIAMALLAADFEFNLDLDETTTQAIDIAFGLIVLGLMAVGLIALAVTVVRRLIRRVRRLLGHS